MREGGCHREIGNYGLKAWLLGSDSLESESQLHFKKKYLFFIYLFVLAAPCLSCSMQTQLRHVDFLVAIRGLLVVACGI